MLFKISKHITYVKKLVLFQQEVTRGVSHRASIRTTPLPPRSTPLPLLPRKITPPTSPPPTNQTAGLRVTMATASKRRRGNEKTLSAGVVEGARLPEGWEEGSSRSPDLLIDDRYRVLTGWTLWIESMVSFVVWDALLCLLSCWLVPAMVDIFNFLVF